MEFMEKKRSMIAFVVLAVIVMLIFQWNNFVTSRNQLEEINTIAQESKNLIEQMNQYYLDDDSKYIDSSLTQEVLDDFNHSIQNLREEGPLPEALVNTYEDLQARHHALTLINSLFEGEYMIEDEINGTLPYRQDISQDRVDQVISQAYFTQPQDAFHNQINFQLRWIDSEFGLYQEIHEHLNNLQYIPIRPRNYAMIARTMDKVENQGAKINNPRLIDNMTEGIESYVTRFIDTISSGLQEESQEWILEQVSPSQILTDAVKENLEAQGEDEDA